MAGAEAETRPAIAGLRLLAVVAALSPAPAAAGAWIAPEGGQEIVTAGVGDRNDAPFYESAGYYEAPFGDENALVFATWGETNYDTVDGWRAEATLGFKQAFYRDDQNVMAVQASALWVSHPQGDCSEGGAELRWLGGRSFGGTGFLNVETAARALSDGCEGGRAEVTAGYRPSPNWLTMGQVFFDAPVDGEETVKAQLTVVRFGRSGRGVQLGLRARIDGGAPEPTLVLGLWGRPDD
ncbi:MAG: hypothetical protein AB7T58_15505 [Hyphomonadaceae bacterium]